MENSHNLENFDSTTDTYTTITIEDFQTFNVNVCTGFIGIIASLGILCGCIVGIIFKDIFKK